MKTYTIVCLLALLGACAQMPASVHATPEELSACATAKDGCSVWTVEELEGFAAFVQQKMMEAFKDMQRQGRSL